jgi:putative ABC transport system permease protein
LAINSGSNQGTNSGRMIEREANITWYDQLPDNNSIAAGEWWGKGGESIQAVSVDEGVAESLNIGVGDELIFNAAGVDLAVTVTSLRRIKWESFQPNFIFVLSPMVARELPQSFITSVNIPEENTQLVDEFLSRYPTVTSINLNTALNQIKNILNKASLAVQYMFLLALLAGVLTLIATIFASADQRRYESALLHTIGAKRSKIFQSIATEFITIGIGAGLTASIGTVFISGFLSTQIFELNYSPNVLVLTGGLIFGAICIGCVGILAVREAVYAPPLLTLRDP